MIWKKSTLLAVACLVLVACGAKDSSSQRLTELKDEDQRAAYAIGMNIAESLSRTGVELDIDAVVQGLRDGSSQSDSLMTRTEIVQTLQSFQSRAQQAMMEKQQQEADKNLTEGEAFLAENAERDDVHVTDSGLQYMVLEKGDGESPEAGDTVLVHYHGTLIDGTVFDSSRDRGEPVTFRVDGVISGWTEALQMMHVGDRWRLFIPPDLAYGERSPGPQIPPNATLIFDVELLGIEDGESAPGQG
jgi:FKBP-type peptidyl-prolyl cis-trans isomerase